MTTSSFQSCDSPLAPCSPPSPPRCRISRTPKKWSSSAWRAMDSISSLDLVRWIRFLLWIWSLLRVWLD
uniref:Uncharacterized protein n=1 Tax=Arundo donax TaxID=35708 RepID=A0A0A9BZ13_ARUDO